MKKRLLAGVLAAALMGSLCSMPVFADSVKTVTIGVDLSAEQKQSMYSYFGINPNDGSIRHIEVNNQQERSYLGSYIPLEQIGSHTYSCAYVAPTSSGGIQVRTANLTYVTSNMIASTLATAGVTNCEVLAASPFPVSGTGALTGAILAYENATGTALDATKVDIANQELATTSKIADSVGDVNAATDLVNGIKIEVISNEEALNEEQVRQIVEARIAAWERENANNQNTSNTGLTDAERELLEELAERIAEVDYNYSDIQQTLERVEQNVSTNVTNVTNNVDNSVTNNTTNNTTNNVDNSVTNNTTNEITNIDNSVTNNTSDEETIVIENQEETPEEPALSEESILMNTNDSALGDNVVIDATTVEAMPEDAVSEEGSAEDNLVIDDGSDAPFEIAVEDAFDSENVDENSEVTEPVVEDGTVDEAVDAPVEETGEEPVDGATDEQVDGNEENAAEETEDAEEPVVEENQHNVLLPNGKQNFAIVLDDSVSEVTSVSLDLKDGSDNVLNSLTTDSIVCGVDAMSDEAGVPYTNVTFLVDADMTGVEKVSGVLSYLNGNGENVTCDLTLDVINNGSSINIVFDNDSLMQGVYRGTFEAEGVASVRVESKGDVWFDAETYDVLNGTNIFVVTANGAGEANIVMYDADGNEIGSEKLFFPDTSDMTFAQESTEEVPVDETSMEENYDAQTPDEGVAGDESALEETTEFGE